VTAYRPPPARHWRSYGDDKLPTGAETMAEPFAAFSSWFMRIECDRCGKVQMVNETHMQRRAMLIRDIISRMRHDGCGGREGKVELITAVRCGRSCCGSEGVRGATCQAD
jgi:hypothetical protein